MKRYAMAYVLWFVAVIAMAAIALEWYRRVENIGWTEVASRLRGADNAPTDDDDET